MSNAKDGLQSYNLFIEYIQLIIDLCEDRNYLAINYLQDIYTRDLCLKIIKNETYGVQIRRYFIELVMKLWIDIYPNFKISMPNKVKVHEVVELRHGERASG